MLQISCISESTNWSIRALPIKRHTDFRNMLVFMIWDPSLVAVGLRNGCDECKIVDYGTGNLSSKCRSKNRFTCDGDRGCEFLRGDVLVFPVLGRWTRRTSAYKGGFFDFEFREGSQKVIGIALASI